jgi:hypothetical protein
MTDLLNIRKLKHHKYLLHKNNEKLKYYSLILPEYELILLKKIVNFRVIETIQKFFRKFKFSDKLCTNLHEIIDINPNDVIKVRIDNDIFGYHYLSFDIHFNINGYCDIKTKTSFDAYTIRRIIKFIKRKSKYKYTSLSNYNKISGYYESNNTDFDFNDILNLFESRGINKIKVTNDMYEEWLQNDDGEVYALELITNNFMNFNRSYAIFDDSPSMDDDVKLPLNIYAQLKTKTNTNNFYYKLIKPLKGERVKLKCLINPSELFNDIKKQLTSDIEKHKILSLNQIICVESDKTHEIIPFVITEIFPSNVIDVTNIDLEIDFDECLQYDDPVSAVLMYLHN